VTADKHTGAHPDPASVAAAAKAWLAESGPAFGPGATLHTALPIHAPDGRFDGWFVPVVAGQHLVAYLRFTAQVARRGLSSFQRQPGAMTGCPLAADWLDLAHITARASAQAGAGMKPGVPVLSYDGSPERLAWRVPFADGGGQRQDVCVAGSAAWVCATSA
jgi:hypothetical protein